MTHIETQIVQHLVEKWAPEVILLGGSRANAEETPSSDWDLYLIGNYPAKECAPEQFAGQHLDVEVRPRSDVAGDIFQLYYGPVRLLRVLLDSSDQLGSRIVEQTRIAYERGPTPKAPDAVEIDRVEMSRIAAKIISHSADPESCFTNLGIFHRMAIQLWFENRGRWSLPPHKGLPIIRSEDPEFASNLKQLTKDSPIASKFDSCATIQQKLWGT
ncbi:MAG: hypothetical protein J0M12_17870 [Deltaproteobacteria bacterium]|nr:hypothetical protein [Deltaproteobacteria bacterium]